MFGIYLLDTNELNYTPVIFQTFTYKNNVVYSHIYNHLYKYFFYQFLHSHLIQIDVILGFW